MRGNIGQLMKQAQMMQDNMRRMQEQLASLEVEGQSGGGLVKVLMTCKHDVKRVTVDPSLVGDDKDMLEDLVAAAFNDAARRVEQTLSYSGMYFVLMGRLSPLDGVGPRDIGMDRLLARASDGVVREVVLATNFTNEGEATAHYVAEMLRTRQIQVSRIARGVPLGGELEFVDVGTISQALLERRGL